MIAALAFLAVNVQTTHPHSSAELVSAVSCGIPGKPFLVGIFMKMDPTWHCYWKNPGDSGIPTTIDWKLPTGWKAGPILWPTPHRIEAGGLVNYAYENSALLLVSVTPPADARSGQVVQLRGDVKWLICQSGCLAASEPVSIGVRLANTTKPDSTWATRIRNAFDALPRANSTLFFSANRESGVIQLNVAEASNLDGLDRAVFFPSDESIEANAPQTVARHGKVISWNLKVSDFAPTQIPRLKGLLVAPGGVSWGHRQDAIVVDIPVTSRRG